MRADGWYWVLPKGYEEHEKEIAKFWNGVWDRVGFSEIFEDSDFAEIDETPLEREKRFGIKPLEWVKDGPFWRAKTPSGSGGYFIVPRGRKKRIYGATGFFEVIIGSIVDAKRFTESHYREQVLKCLTE